MLLSCQNLSFMSLWGRLTSSSILLFFGGMLCCFGVGIVLDHLSATLLTSVVAFSGFMLFGNTPASVAFWASSICDCWASNKRDCICVILCCVFLSQHFLSNSTARVERHVLKISQNIENVQKRSKKENVTNIPLYYNRNHYSNVFKAIIVVWF